MTMENQPDPSTPYILVAVMGQTPSILTETVWSLVVQEDPPWVPQSVHVITTSIGKAGIEARLLGKAVRDPVTGRPIPDSRNRWAEFCRDILDDHTPEIHFHIPDRGGSHMRDIRDVFQDAAFADMCYQTVADVITDDGPRVVGSIAGGRKTMSAHLMTAFSVYARPQDRLVHVLVDPPELEFNREFFYPTEDGPTSRIDRVDITFPRLRTIVGKHLIDTLPGDRRDLRAILQQLERHLAALEVPAFARITTRERKLYLELCREDGSAIQSCTLAPAEVATFLVLAESIAVGNGQVSFSDLPDAAIEKQRAAVKWTGKPKPWTNNDDVSKAVSAYHAKVKDHPAILAALGFASERSYDETIYKWAAEAPAPIRSIVLPENYDWPFEHLPKIEPLAQDSTELSRR